MIVSRCINQENINLPTVHMNPDKIPGPAAIGAAKLGYSQDADRYGNAVAIGVKIPIAIPKDGKNALPCNIKRYLISSEFEKKQNDRTHREWDFNMLSVDSFQGNRIVTKKTREKNEVLKAEA